MKRRFFVQSAACTTLGAGIPLSQVLSQAADHGGASLIHELNRTEWSLLIQRRVHACHGAESFQLATAAKCEFLATQGFLKEAAHAYFFGTHEQFSFFPVVKRDPASGSVEVLLPVFVRDSNHQWQYVHTLSGYQLEAMIKASQALRQSGPVSIERLVLPIGKGGVTDHKSAYRTQEGIVDMVTKINKGHISTTCTIRDASGIVFSDSFTHR